MSCGTTPIRDLGSRRRSLPVNRCGQERELRLSVIRHSITSVPSDDQRSLRAAEVVAYDERWPRMFRQVAAEVNRALAGIEHEVEHIGSTSVPGLAGKPIIDLFAVVSSSDDVQAAIAALGQHGWLHEGDGGLEGRESFPVRPDLPYQHLYLVVRGNEQHLLQTRFRDILRADEQARTEYAGLKAKLAPLLATDRAAYSEGKTELVHSVLRRHGFPTWSGVR
ncbi:GrpB family protein [Microlunatus endophyticus]|uniref:GrpB family protein n=1 Tax=Microlunatus endophyticus TaxID=1716077 RepID=UPI00227A60D9|nr:GrpB family protein [Microlunatus endophyticus]